MAEKRNSRDDESRPPKKDKSDIYPLPEPEEVEEDGEEEEAEEEESEEPKQGGLAGIVDKIKNHPWVKKNPQLAGGIGGGVALLMVALVLAWLLGWFGGETKKKRPVAPRAAAGGPAGAGHPGDDA